MPLFLDTGTDLSDLLASALFLHWMWHQMTSVDFDVLHTRPKELYFKAADDARQG